MASPTNDMLICTPLRAAADLSPPRFAMPALACDAHMHVFGPLADYPCVAHPHYDWPDAALAHYRAAMQALQLQRFVIVQPSFYGTDNGCLLDALADAGPAARGVVMIEEHTDAATLARWHALGVRAVRLDLFARAGWPTHEIEQYIARIAAVVRPLGWHVQFYAPGWVVKNLIPFLATLETDFVIDHMGYMLAEDGLGAQDFDQLLELLQRGKCWLKLSAPYRIAKTRGLDTVAPMARGIIQAAPRQVVWGSDWPHLPGLMRDTGELLNLLVDWTDDAVTRDAILVDNPARLFDY